MTEPEWHCTAYGDDPDVIAAGAVCFFADLHQRDCASHDECARRMDAERRRVHERIGDLAAAGDEMATYLAAKFPHPDQLLNADAPAADRAPEPLTADTIRRWLTSAYDAGYAAAMGDPTGAHTVDEIEALAERFGHEEMQQSPGREVLALIAKLEGTQCNTATTTATTASNPPRPTGPAGAPTPPTTTP